MNGPLIWLLATFGFTCLLTGPFSFLFLFIDNKPKEGETIPENEPDEFEETKTAIIKGFFSSLLLNLFIASFYFRTFFLTY